MIVGAGPAGFAASLTARAHGMKFVTVEQDSLGGAVFQYPRGKIVMTAPVTLPIVGKVNFGQTSKEALLEVWEAVERKTGLADPLPRARRVDRADGERASSCARPGDYRAASVLLAIGRRGHRASSVSGRGPAARSSTG